MKNYFATFLLSTIALLLLSPTTSAQTAAPAPEKFPVRLIPRPNTTSQLHMIQNVEMEVTFENASADAPSLPPMKMLLKSIIDMTQKNGAPGKQGQLEAEITYDNATLDMTMNGNPAPPSDEMAKLIGKKFTVVYDEKGNYLDVKTTADLGIPIEALKEMMQKMYGTLPQDPMSVGETISRPFEMSLPFPLPGMKPILMTGAAKSKLAGIEKAGTGQVASFSQIVDARASTDGEMPNPQGGEAIKMHLDFKLTGGGDMKLNTEKGLLQSSEMTSNIEGRITWPDKSTPIPEIVLKGTIKVSVTGKN